MSLTEKTRTGLREMPSNAAWLLSRALKPAEALGDAAESAATEVRDRGRQVSAALIDATPGTGDSVDVRMRRAREAAEQAREAEDQAVQAAQEAKARSDRARQVNERGRAYLAEVRRETERAVKQRVAEAQKAADESVRREREDALGTADKQRREAQAEVDAELQSAERDAHEAQEHAEELVADATAKLAEARRLADEAAEAARGAAEDAHRRAQELAQEAQEQAGDADSRIQAAEQLRVRSEATAKSTARDLKRAPLNGDLESYSKPDLVNLASSMGIEGRTTMNKAELVGAITKASRSRR